MAVLFEDAVVARCPLSGPHDSSLLAPGEIALVDSARSESRAAELRAGRLAARSAFLAAGLSRPPALLRQPDGRPQLEPPLEGWRVSIAHDAPFAVAAVARTPVGIDLLSLQRLDSVRQVVAGRVSSGRALAPIVEGEVPWPLEALAWTGWEAKAKCSGESVLSAMKQALKVETKDAVSGRSGAVRLRWWSEEDLLFCLATAPR